MEGVALAQGAVDAAQDNYDAAVAKQAKTAAAMAEVQKRLKKLQETGKTLDEIKSVLRDCISVLVDLAIQVGKLEQFFIMLTTVIDNVVMPRAETFAKEMGKAGNLKAYFSLLQDISAMYSVVHRDYIIQGVDMCGKLSKGAASNDPMEKLQQDLADYSEKSAKAVATMVSAKQKEILDGLRDRAKKAAEGVQLLENTVAEKGIKIDSSTKAAIQAGADKAKEEAKAILDASPSATVQVNTENVDASDM
ncbi:hypothetical protein ABW21_db0207762 [Orbilia brochopaga]|nr:hypothetical protein ABW21_db0207762 [Drechslerella brochopaga]